MPHRTVITSRLAQRRWLEALQAWARGYRLWRFECDCGEVGKWRRSKRSAELDAGEHAPDSPMHPAFPTGAP